MRNIQSPNSDTIEEYLFKWTQLEEHYIWEDSSLNRLFQFDYTDNTDLNKIMIKCSSLNDFYSTNIFQVYPVAKKIFDMKIDDRLKKGDPTLVNDIAKVKIKNKNKNFYSFASKYCSHHNEDYPIYDYYVDRMLVYFKTKDKFANFIREDLKDYVKFKKIILEFRKFYDLEGFTLRDIDKYLWIAGKEYFPKDNQNKKD